jgi:hypothetical protein
MPPVAYWFTGAALGSFLALVATVSSLSYAWYSAAKNEQSIANSSAVVDREKARLKVIREALQGFYISGGVILNKQILKTVTPADFDKYAEEVNAWLNNANDWIFKNLGAAASARFLDTGGGLSLLWDRAANPQHNGIINALIKHRENLTKMIEVNAWDSGDAASKP